MFLKSSVTGFCRVRREFSVSAEGLHIFGYKDLTEAGNRARKVSGTQGTPHVFHRGARKITFVLERLY